MGKEKSPLQQEEDTELLVSVVTAFNCKANKETGSAITDPLQDGCGAAQRRHNNALVTARGEERREERRERRERDRCSDAMKSIFHPSYPLLIRSLSTHVNSISSMGLSLRLCFFFLLAKNIWH
jgi:hypothetical protein